MAHECRNRKYEQMKLKSTEIRSIAHFNNAHFEILEKLIGVC
jgi:hypothetical protein